VKRHVPPPPPYFIDPDWPLKKKSIDVTQKNLNGKKKELREKKYMPVCSFESLIAGKSVINIFESAFLETSKKAVLDFNTITYTIQIETSLSSTYNLKSLFLIHFFHIHQ